jgi:manganese efflux pump family protein
MRVSGLFGIALAVSMDSLAVAIATGLSQRGRSLARAVRLALCFGCAQASTMALGLLVGRHLHLATRVAPWAACLLLAWVGSRMMASSARGDERAVDLDPTRGVPLLMLSLGTSLDGLAVGIPLGGLGASISSLVPITGAVVASFAFVGAQCASHFGRLWGRRAEFAGGAALCFIGARILLAR